MVRIARQRAGLTQQQLADRSGHPRETIARWETGSREPSLTSVQALVAACGLELVVGLAAGDDSLAQLIADQITLMPSERLARLLAADDRTAALSALHWLAGARTPSIVIGAMAAALQGAPQRLTDSRVELVAGDQPALVAEMTEAGLWPTDSPERFADTDRRWPWTLPGGGTLVLAGGLPGARDYADLRRAARPVRLDVVTVQVAHPRDLLRLAEASPRPDQRARVPALRALLDASSHEP